jgi:thioredoxin reductase
MNDALPTPHDVIIVGGGPAGLTAALHLAWHDHDVLVIDRRTGPLFFTLEALHNVPGLPAVRGLDLQAQLRAQAKGRGAEFVRGNVTSATGQAGAFALTGAKGEAWHARVLLLATGVARYHPTIDGDIAPCFKYAGKGNLYYCPDCEAPEVKGKDTVVIGTGPADWAAGMAVGLSRYTDRLRVLLTGGTDLSATHADRLRDKGIAVTVGAIKELVGKPGRLETLKLADGVELSAEKFFVSSEVHGRTDLAKQLGVDLAPTGEHAQPRSQRGDTSVPGVWIAGDLRPMTQQVSVAFGTGNIAAVMIDQHLRRQAVLD